jgi:hypothetical protein
MKLDSVRKQLVDAFELTDEELAGVVGGDGCCGNNNHGHNHQKQRRCKRWDRRGHCRQWGYW